MRVRSLTSPGASPTGREPVPERGAIETLHGSETLPSPRPLSPHVVKVRRSRLPAAVSSDSGGCHPSTYPRAPRRAGHVVRAEKTPDGSSPVCWLPSHNQGGGGEQNMAQSRHPPDAVPERGKEQGHWPTAIGAPANQSCPPRGPDARQTLASLPQTHLHRAALRKPRRPRQLP